MLKYLVSVSIITHELVDSITEHIHGARVSDII